MKQNDAQYEEEYDYEEEQDVKIEFWKICLIGALLLFAISMILLTVQNPKWPLEIFAPQGGGASSSAIAPAGSASSTQSDVSQNSSQSTALSYVLNTLPVFPTGTQPGTLEIASSEDNVYDLQVHVILKETQEVVYISPVLAPGEMQKNAVLEKALAAGEYPATAEIVLLDEQGNKVSSVQVDMNILVKE